MTTIIPLIIPFNSENPAAAVGYLIGIAFCVGIVVGVGIERDVLSTFSDRLNALKKLHFHKWVKTYSFPAFTFTSDRVDTFYCAKCGKTKNKRASP